MPTLIAFTAGLNAVHVKKITHTVIGDVVELEEIVAIGDTFETHITTDHVLTITELDPNKPVLELTEKVPGELLPWDGKPLVSADAPQQTNGEPPAGTPLTPEELAANAPPATAAAPIATDPAATEPLDQSQT